MSSGVSRNFILEMVSSETYGLMRCLLPLVAKSDNDDVRRAALVLLTHLAREHENKMVFVRDRGEGFSNVLSEVEILLESQTMSSVPSRLQALIFLSVLSRYKFSGKALANWNGKRNARYICIYACVCAYLHR